MQNLNDVLFITGAGISVASGIQPFRGKDGIWEKQSTENATFKRFQEYPLDFLTWYYHRFGMCSSALPNEAHKILAKMNAKVITQNVDSLHRAAGHDMNNLVEIHGNIHYKRKVNEYDKNGIIPAYWGNLSENNLRAELAEMFNIKDNIVRGDSYRPHVLLFDERYSDMYDLPKALKFLDDAKTVIFIGTSNAVGITEMALQEAVYADKEIIVVDPNPSETFEYYGVKFFRMDAIEFLQKFEDNLQ
jgi:NAD-dependent deacetylase